MEIFLHKLYMSLHFILTFPPHTKRFCARTPLSYFKFNRKPRSGISFWMTISASIMHLVFNFFNECRILKILHMDVDLKLFWPQHQYIQIIMEWKMLTLVPISSQTQFIAQVLPKILEINLSIQFVSHFESNQGHYLFLMQL